MTIRTMNGSQKSGNNAGYLQDTCILKIRVPILCFNHLHVHARMLSLYWTISSNYNIVDVKYVKGGVSSFYLRVTNYLKYTSKIIIINKKKSHGKYVIHIGDNTMRN